MSKKPASLTSDLLARKGEAEPSTIDPSARMTLSAGPGFDEEYGGGRTEPHSDDDHDDDDGYDNRGSRRPMPPEPEIIYTAEESRGGGSNTRLIIAAVLGLIIVSGIFLATSGQEPGSVAPVQSNIAAQTAPAAETSAAPTNMAPGETAEAPVTTPPAAPETMSAAPAGEAPSAADATPAETKIPVVEAPPANAPTDISPNATAVPATQVPPAAEMPAAPEKVATPAPSAKPQSNGAYVVQLLALQDEASAKAAWKKVSKKHANILDGHALNIEKADLGSKGTWYRVRAAGFATKAAAASACTKLKAAGQDCIAKKR